MQKNPISRFESYSPPPICQPQLKTYSSLDIVAAYILCPFLCSFFFIFHVIAYRFYVFPFLLLFVYRISPCNMHMLLFPSCCLFPHCLIHRLTCVFTFLYTDIHSYSITLSSRPFMYLYSGISPIARNIIIIALDIFALAYLHSLRWFAIPPIPTYIIHLGIHAVPTTHILLS